MQVLTISSYLVSMSDLAIDLVKNLMHPSVENRLDGKAVLSDQWILSHLGTTSKTTMFDKYDGSHEIALPPNDHLVQYFLDLQNQAQREGDNAPKRKTSNTLSNGGTFGGTQTCGMNLLSVPIKKGLGQQQSLGDRDASTNGEIIKRTEETKTGGSKLSGLANMTPSQAQSKNDPIEQIMVNSGVPMLQRMAFFQNLKKLLANMGQKNAKGINFEFDLNSLAKVSQLPCLC